MFTSFTLRRARQCGICFLTAVVLLACSATLSHAQTASGTILGRVVDPKDLVIPGAAVVARKVDTGIERTTVTTVEGLYRFDNLPPGFYDVRVEAQNFARAEAKAVKLQVGEQRDVNFRLALAGTVERVAVSSEIPLVETSKTDVSSVIDDKQVPGLPVTSVFTLGGVSSLNGGGIANDYQGLATLAPGVKYDVAAITSDLVGPGEVNNRGNLVNIDGGNIIDQVVSTRDALGASLEEVKEFQVLTNNYNAEYGQAGSLILNVVTKSGNNGFHGDGHFYFRGRNLQASNFFYNALDPRAATGARAPFHKKEGGFTAGGPFVKDRTFWFVSYEQARQSLPLTLTPPSGAVTVQTPTNDLLWSGKIDHQIAKNYHFTARYNVERVITTNSPTQLPTIHATPEVLTDLVSHDNTLNLALTSTPTTHTVNEFRFFWHRWLTDLPTKSTLPGQKGPNFYHGAPFCCPQGGLQNRYQFIDNFSWTHGAHTIKTGFNISHFPYNSLFQQFHFGEWEAFAGNPLLPTQFTIGLGPGFVETKDNIYGFYVQDSWKLRRNLTLNYGLRYDVEDGAFTGGTIPNPAGGCFEANGIIPACSSDKNNFQPRVGIAWSPEFQSGFLHWLFGDPAKSVIRASFAEVTELAYLNISLDSLNFDGTVLFTTTITDPSVLAFFPNRPSAAALAPFIPTTRTFFGRVRPIAPDLKNAETRHAHLSITRQIGDSFVVEGGYIGVFGFGLYGERDRNYAKPIADTRPGIPAGFFYLPDRPDARFLAERVNDNSRTSAYHGGYFSIRKRLSHHIEFQGNYTLSKILATSEDFFGVSEPGDPFNIRADRALAQNDVRHQGNFSVVMDTERTFQSSFVKHILGNWTVGLIGQLQSGRPYPVSTGDAPLAGSIFGGTGLETQQRPNVLPDGTLVATNIAASGGTNLLVSQNGAAMCACPRTTFLAPTAPFTTSAGTFPAASTSGPVDSFSGDPVDFQFLNGNLVRNAGHTRPYYRLDLSLMKAFPVPGHETWRVQLKADFFNVFNHPNFLLNNGGDVLNALPISTDPNCRSCLNAFTGRFIGSDGRVLHIQDLQSGIVSPDIANPIFAGLGDATTTDLSRTIQLSVRFRW
jgi:Carboxypeptidase regulatory-like domain/TonB dependent receptor